MDLALALLAASLPLSIWLWQGGRSERQFSAIAWQREKFSAEQLGEQKRWEDAQTANNARIHALEQTLGATADAITIRLKRLEDNRESLRRAG